MQESACSRLRKGPDCRGICTGEQAEREKIKHVNWDCEIRNSKAAAIKEKLYCDQNQFYTIMHGLKKFSLFQHLFSCVNNCWSTKNGAYLMKIGKGIRFTM